jgi:hypothetical protein
MRFPLMTPVLSLLVLLSIPSMASKLSIGEFSGKSLEGWSVELFKGKTDYTMFSENGRIVLKAHSVRAALFFS